MFRADEDWAVVRRFARLVRFPIGIDAIARAWCPVRITVARFIVAVLVALACFAAVGNAQLNGAIINIEIFDKPAIFRPEHPKIKVGQTVRWVNKGDTVHTVTADPSQAPDPTWVSVPPGSQELDSGYMSPGDSFSYEFKVPGTYRYFCLTHEMEGMRGQVDVEK